MCCETPPGTDVFKFAKGTTGGPAGVFTFYEKNSDGTCGGCTGGGSLGTCYTNHPFEPASVLGITNRCRTDGTVDPTKMK